LIFVEPVVRQRRGRGAGGEHEGEPGEGDEDWSGVFHGGDGCHFKAASYGASRESRAYGEQTARTIIAEGIAVAGLSEEELKALPGSEARKAAIARLVWERTTMDMKWIAAQLGLRSTANASQQIRRHRKEPPKLPKSLQEWVRQSRNVA